MTYDEIQKYKYMAFTKARTEKKHIGALKPPKGPVFFAEIDPPLKGQLSFKDVNKYPGHSLIAYGLPNLIHGYNKINPTEWKNDALKRASEMKGQLFEASYS